MEWAGYPKTGKMAAVVVTYLLCSRGPNANLDTNCVYALKSCHAGHVQYDVLLSFCGICQGLS